MGDLNYSYAVARIRVREKSLLSDADVSQMAGLKDADAVLSFLLDRGWGDADSGRNPDRVFLAEEKKAWKLMEELGVDPEVFDVLSYPRLYHNLKAGIKAVCTGNEDPAVFYSDVAISGEKMLAAVRDQEWDQLPEHMRSAAARAMEVMLKTRDGQMCDVIVDRAALDAMAEAGRKTKHAIVKEYASSQVAVTDIKIAVRAAKTGKSLAFLKDALAPSDRLDVRKMALAASEGEQALYEYLADHGYAEAVEALKISPSAFERWCDNRLIETIRPQKRNPFSIGPVVAFYLAKENEIRTARIVLTAKANGFPEEAIRERIREMYV